MVLKATLKFFVQTQEKFALKTTLSIFERNFFVPKWTPKDKKNCILFQKSQTQRDCKNQIQATENLTLGHLKEVLQRENQGLKVYPVDRS